ncbi:MAG: hypothetical protein LBJ21_00825 [Acidobacteriota bacterium]|nr:hypothetical protein [Acidobacteriota bacterium]
MENIERRRRAGKASWNNNEQQSLDVLSLKNAVGALKDSIAEYDESVPDRNVRRRDAPRSDVNPY